MRTLPILALAGLIGLAGCSDGAGLSRTFGFTRDAPDEFRVATQAPLSMPPDLALRAPRPGEPRPQDVTQTQAAEAVLSPDSILAAPTTAVSPGQQALIAAAGPPAPANIRDRVDSDSRLDNPGNSFTDRLLFWRTPPQPGTVVDATRESQRLRQDAALGQSPQAGDTPIIQRKRTGLLGSIF